MPAVARHHHPPPLRACARWMIAVISAAYSTFGLARFLEEDADFVDREERLSTETYNDKISYRYPEIWEGIWRKRKVGYRVTAGSLNANRFSYEEDIKLKVNPDKDASFSFHQTRREDMIESRLEQEIRVSWRPFADIRYSLMADGGTLKQFGDLGVAIGYNPDEERNIEAFYWSTDHYYDTKKDFEEDGRERKTYSSGFSGDWKFHRIFRTSLFYEYDQPLRWDRPSRNYQYDYLRRVGNLGFFIGDGSAISGYLLLHQEHKEETKTFYLANNLSHELSMSRRVAQYDTAVIHTLGRTLISTGGMFIQRDAEYGFSADTGVTESSYVEEPHPDSSKRRELGYFTTVYFPLTSHFMQLGVHINNVRIDEGGSEFRENEVKAQVAWDILYSDKCRTFINTTWDLDQLQKDGGSNFRPWGGGNIQFLATF